MTAQQEALYDQAGRLFAPAIARLAHAMERDRELARDLEQDIHTAIWRSLARFDERCSLKTWVYRVAHNTAADHVERARRRRQTVSLDEIEGLPALGSGEADHARAMTLERVHTLIARLKQPDATIILLWLEQASTQEIAEVTGLSPTNVGVKIHRIRKLLASHFGEQAEEDAP